MSAKPATARRDRRAVGDCEIWSLIAPDVACPACGGSFQDRLEQAVVAVEVDDVTVEVDEVAAAPAEQVEDARGIAEVAAAVLAVDEQVMDPRDARDELAALWGELPA